MPFRSLPQALLQRISGGCECIRRNARLVALDGRMRVNCNLQQTPSPTVFVLDTFIGSTVVMRPGHSPAARRREMKKSVPYIIAAALAVGLVSAAQAHVSVGIGLGIPVAPAYPVAAYAPPPVVYAPPPAIYAPPPVVVGGYYGYGYGYPYWHHGYYRGGYRHYHRR